MWILENSKDLLEYIQSMSLSSYNSIKTFDFSTLYTTIPHSKLKDRIRELFLLFFIEKNIQRRYKYLIHFCYIPLLTKIQFFGTRFTLSDDTIKTIRTMFVSALVRQFGSCFRIFDIDMTEKLATYSFFYLFLKLVQINYISFDNVRILGTVI